MSPEQCSGSEVDHRTDIYALGVMLYQMACGRVPFDADHLLGVLSKHVYERPIAPSEIDEDISGGLEAIILRCLAKARDARYGSALALREDLVALRDGSTPSAVIAAMGAPCPRPRPSVWSLRGLSPSPSRSSRPAGAAGLSWCS